MAGTSNRRELNDFLSSFNNDSSTTFFGLTRESFEPMNKGVSFKIVNERKHEIAHYLVSNIVSWEVKGTKIIIHAQDEEPITYVFISSVDAAIADQKINDFVNGII